MINAQTRFVWRYVWNLGSPKVFRKEKQKPLQINMLVFFVLAFFLQVFKDVFLETSLVAFQKRSRQSSLGRPITVVSLAGAWEEIELRGFCMVLFMVFLMKKTCFLFLFHEKMFFWLFLVTFVGLTFGLFVGTVSVFLLIPLI